MTRKTDPPATQKETSAAPSGFDVFRKSKDERRTALTHETIADDLAAFQRAGGKIEVLGTTYTLKSIARASAAAAAAPTVSDEQRGDAASCAIE